MKKQQRKYLEIRMEKAKKKNRERNLNLQWNFFCGKKRNYMHTYREKQAKECLINLAIYYIMPIYKINELKTTKNNMKLK